MNSGSIAEAIVARLHQSNPAAVAAGTGPYRLRDIVARLGVKLHQATDFADVFDQLSSHDSGTHALLVILDQLTVSTHVVIITNQKGVPTIIEGQNWGPNYPAGVYTSAAEAEARYGSNVDLKLGLIPQPAAQ